MIEKIKKSISLTRRELAKQSLWAFALIYMRDYLKLLPSPAHQEIYGVLMDLLKNRGGKFALAAPREFGKSTQITLLYVVYCICFKMEKFILIISNTSGLSEAILDNIKRVLTTNSLIREDFPEVFEAQGDPMPPRWTRADIETRNGVKIMALGATQSMRGLRFGKYRPTLVIADDIEKGQSSITIETIGKIKDWFNTSILKIGSEETNFIILGTLFHPHCLLADYLNSEKQPAWIKRVYPAIIAWAENRDLWAQWSNIYNSREAYEGALGPAAALKFYEANKEAMDKGAQVLWPEKWSYYKLVEENEADPISFSSERQNCPIDPKTQIFKMDELHFWTDQQNGLEQLLKFLGDDISIFGACDPSLGDDTTRGDYSAIIVVIRDNKTDVLYEVVADIKRRSVDATINDIIDYARRFRFTKFVVETNNFQALMLKQLEERCKAEKILLNIEEVKNNSRKKERIQVLHSVTKTGALQLNRNHRLLLEQLCFFPKAPHDDGPDALQMSVIAAQDRGKVEVYIVESKDDSWVYDYEKNFGWNLHF